MSHFLNMGLSRRSINGETILASIHRSKRVKTSELIVDETGVELRTPLNKPLTEIEAIIRKKKLMRDCIAVSVLLIQTMVGSMLVK